MLLPPRTICTNLPEHFSTLAIMSTAKPATVDAYIAGFPETTRAALEAVCSAVREAAPDAEECISYGIPTYKRGKALVHFGGFKAHVGFYATPTGHEAFAEELGKYKQGRGSVQFPLDEPMPLELIKRIVRFRMEEVMAKK